MAGWPSCVDHHDLACSWPAARSASSGWCDPPGLVSGGRPARWQLVVATRDTDAPMVSATSWDL